MRDIAALVFGSGPGDPGGPRPSREPRTARDAGICDGPPVPGGDWCQTQPGRATLAWFGLTFGPGGRERRCDLGGHRTPR